ncbi:MAG TPA: hypothetical protein VGH09_12500 [Solirubrobacteraceae bacterium]|jgi:hypothetical protein
MQIKIRKNKPIPDVRNAPAGKPQVSTHFVDGPGSPDAPQRFLAAPDCRSGDRAHRFQVVAGEPVERCMVCGGYTEVEFAGRVWNWEDTPRQEAPIDKWAGFFEGLARSPQENAELGRFNAAHRR